MSKESETKWVHIDKKNELSDSELIVFINLHTRRIQQEVNLTNTDIPLLLTDIAWLLETFPITILKDAFESKNRALDASFVKNLCLLFTSFLEKHGSLIENKDNKLFNNLLDYIVFISLVNSVEIFEICLKYWNMITFDLCYDNSTNPPSKMPKEKAMRRNIYKSTLAKMRRIIIFKIAKPDEVLVNLNNLGVEDYTKQTESTDNMHTIFRNTLKNLAHLDLEDTQIVMTAMLNKQVYSKQLSLEDLNRICWAIGSISGAIDQEKNKLFLSTVIESLFDLFDEKRENDTQMIIASNFIYIVGQYPLFFPSNRSILKDVVKKLCDFINGGVGGVFIMACETLCKIAKTCRDVRNVRDFRDVFKPDLIDSLIERVYELTKESKAKLLLSSAILYMISNLDQPGLERLLIRFFNTGNSVFDSIVLNDVNNLNNEIILEEILFFLNINLIACNALGHSYIRQLRIVYKNLMTIYGMMNEKINEAIQQRIRDCIKESLINSMRAVKKESLRLIGSWISIAAPEDTKMIVDEFIPTLLEVVLLGYKNNTAEAREAEVLVTMDIIINKLKDKITKEILTKIFDSLLKCTLLMIDHFPEHRKNFFMLLRTVNTQCFAILVKLKDSQFKLLLDWVICAFKYDDVAKTRLMIVHELLNNVQNHSDSQSFYKDNYIKIMQHVFSVVTDSSDNASLTYRSQILVHMFALLKNSKIVVPLSPQSLDSAHNIEFVQRTVFNLMKTAYSHLQDQQIGVIIKSLFFCNDLQLFKKTLGSLIDKCSFCVSIYLGWDKELGYQLFQSDQSVNYGGWKASRIGNNNQTAISILKQKYNIDDKKLTDSLRLVIKMLSKTLDTNKLTNDLIQVGTVTRENDQIQIRLLTEKELNDMLIGESENNHEHNNRNIDEIFQRIDQHIYHNFEIEEHIYQEIEGITERTQQTFVSYLDSITNLKRK